MQGVGSRISGARLVKPPGTKQISEADLFGYVRQHGTRAKRGYTRAGKRKYKDRASRANTATVWFLDQFDVEKLQEAFRGSKADWDPNGPMDLKWMVGRMRQMVCSNRIQSQRTGLEMLRNLQQLGAVPHPKVQEAFREDPETPVPGEDHASESKASSEDDFLAGIDNGEDEGEGEGGGGGACPRHGPDGGGNAVPGDG